MSPKFVVLAVFVALFLAMPVLAAASTNSTNRTGTPTDYTVKGPIEDVAKVNPLVTVVGTTVLLAGATAVIVGTMYYRAHKRTKWK